MRQQEVEVLREIKHNLGVMMLLEMEMLKENRKKNKIVELFQKLGVMMLLKMEMFKENGKTNKIVELFQKLLIPQMKVMML